MTFILCCLSIRWVLTWSPFFNKGIECFGWKYIEKPNTIRDMNVFNQWCEDYDYTEYFSGSWAPFKRAAKFQYYDQTLEVRNHWDIKDMVIEIK